MHKPKRTRAHSGPSRRSPAKSGLYLGTILVLLTFPSLLIAQTTAPASSPIPDPSVLQGLSLGAGEQKTLDSHGALFLRHKTLAELKYLPRINGQAAMLREVADLKPQMVLELLQVLPRPESWKGKSLESLMLGLYNLLHGMKSMEGMLYWSNTEQKEKVLISYSRTVGSSGDRSEKPDQTFAKTEASHSFWAVQEDSRLGRNLYRIDIRTKSENMLEFVTTNQEQLWLGIVPVVRPQGMQTRVYLCLEESGLVFYALTALDIGGAFGIDEHLSDSYRRRGSALFDWVKSRLERL